MCVEGGGREGTGGAQYIDRERKYGSFNYAPLPVVLSRGSGRWCGARGRRGGRGARH
jgi:hypothetical protein